MNAAASQMLDALQTAKACLERLDQVEKSKTAYGDICSAIQAAATIRALPAEGNGALAWRPVEEAQDDELVLVGCPESGPTPVVAWRIEGEWYEFGIYGKTLRPQPTIWTKWPKMPRVAVTRGDGQ